MRLLRFLDQPRERIATKRCARAVTARPEATRVCADNRSIGRRHSFRPECTDIQIRNSSGS